HPIPTFVSRPDGRPGKRRKVAGEESPGSMDIRCRIMSGGGDRRETATENRPPAHASAQAGEGETVRQQRPACPATGAARQTPPAAKPNRGGAEEQSSGPVSGSGPRVGCSRRRATG